MFVENERRRKTTVVVAGRLCKYELSKAFLSGNYHWLNVVIESVQNAYCSAVLIIVDLSRIYWVILLWSVNIFMFKQEGNFLGN